MISRNAARDALVPLRPRAEHGGDDLGLHGKPAVDAQLPSQRVDETRRHAERGQRRAHCAAGQHASALDPLGLRCAERCGAAVVAVVLCLFVFFSVITAAAAAAAATAQARSTRSAGAGGGRGGGSGGGGGAVLVASALERCRVIGIAALRLRRKWAHCLGVALALERRHRVQMLEVQCRDLVRGSGGRAGAVATAAE